MSCYICDDRHITVLAAYAVRHHLFNRDRALLSYDDQQAFKNTGDAETLAALMFRENVASFRARYQGRHESDIGTFAYDRDAAIAVRVSSFSAVQIIKAAHCFSYQACEHDGWEASLIHRVIEDIIGHATRELPGYDAATWGIPDAPAPVAPPAPVALPAPVAVAPVVVPAPTKSAKKAAKRPAKRLATKVFGGRLINRPSL